MDNLTYSKFKFNFSPATYAEIGIHLEKYGVKRMYEVQVNEGDINYMLSIPQIKIFWCCRCHRVRGDGSAENERWHALVQFDNDRFLDSFLRTYMKRMRWGKVRSRHPTSAFKKILCPDQALGVLGNISCKGGKLSRRGLAPHTHYDRSVDNKLRLLHTRDNQQCTFIRSEIYDAVTLHVTRAWMKENSYLGISQEKKELHNREICRCERKLIFKKEKSGDDTLRAFYKREEGEKEKEAIKRKLLEFLSQTGSKKKTKFYREIEKLTAML